MPVATRRRSRLTEGNVGNFGEERKDEVGLGEWGRVDSARVEEGDGMNKGEERVLGGDKIADFELEVVGGNENKNGTEETEEEVPISQRARQRTFSMEMHDALEALHREEEEVEVAQGKRFFQMHPYDVHRLILDI